MRFDFWNNPLVVTALRQKYRGGALGVSAAGYVMALVALGGIIRFSSAQTTQWVFYYFVAVIIAQFALSAFGSVGATSASIQSEVASNTFDAQRIATLSPRQIMIGKLIGQPATVHFLAQCTLPIVLWCSFMADISLWVVGLLYLQIFTTSFLFGSIGLLTPTEVTAKRSGPNIGFGIPIAVMAVFFSANSALARVPGLSVFLGSIMPAETIRAVVTRDPWRAGLHFYHLDIPFILAAPLGQLALGCILLNAASRKLANPQNPMLSKTLAYIMIVIVDVLAAGNVVDSTFGQFDIRSAALFCLVHLLASFMLTVGATPGRESLLSWAWRYRGRAPAVLDSALGERSDNSMVVAIFSLMTPVMLMLLVWLPLWLDGRAAPFKAAVTNAAPVIVVTMLLIAALGILYQWFVLIAAKSGRVIYFLFVLLLLMAPPMLSQVPGYGELRNFSPAVHYTQWLGARFNGRTLPPPLRLAPIAVIYGTLLVAAWASKQRRMRRQIQRIDQTLIKMGVPEALRPASAAAKR